MNAQRYLTTREAAEALRLTTPTMARWIRLGQIKAVRVGSIWRIPESEVKRLLMEDIRELNNELTEV